MSAKISPVGVSDFSAWPKLKYVAKIRGGAGFPPEEQGQTGNELPFYKVNALESSTKNGVLSAPGDTVSSITAERLGAHIFNPGTTVFAKVGAALLLNRFRQINCPACLDNNMMGLEPDESRVLPRYLMYALCTKDLSFVANPGAVPSVNASQIADERIYCPSIVQQTRIANFLDEQTARIDALIAEKERLDALLGEYRGSLISAAVMGQLSTAIVSAGRVGGGVKPASWRKLSLKRVAEIMPSNVDKHSVEGELPVRLCNYVDVYNNDRIDDSIDFMVATASEAQITRFTLKAQDVLVTKDSEEPSDIGIPAYVPQDMPGILCGYHLAVLRPDLMRVHGAFLHWALQSTEVQAYYETAALGISRYALGINDLGMTPLHLPDRAEQTRIANFLDEQTTRIDDLRNHCREHIALLREYRFSLISAAVTGQLDIDAFGRQVA